MPEPILSIGDLEPDRPTVAINRNAPDGPWQRFKHRHFDLLLRFFPVRYRQRRDLYALRLPSEFGLKTIQRIQSAQREVLELQRRESDPASTARASRLLRQVSGEILEAPGDVLDALSDSQHIQILLAFPDAVTGPKPRPIRPENPSTSGSSSPTSAGSIPATPGATG